MFSRLSKMFNYIQLKSINKKQNNNEENHNTANKHNIPSLIDDLKSKLHETFKDCDDLVIREIQIGSESQIKLVVAYIESLINKQTLNNNILTPLMINIRETHLDKDINQDNLTNVFIENLLPTSLIKDITDYKKTIDSILNGNTMIYIDGIDIALEIDTVKSYGRNIEKPISETVIRGPREAFVESLDINIALIRQKIKSPKFKVEKYQFGEQSNTNVVICYLKDIADENVIKTLKRRLEKIKIDAIIDSGYIEQFIEDAPFSPFSTVANSEKPDRIAAKMLEGRVAILCDGSPTVLTVPHLFVEIIQSSDDYYSRFFWGTLNRILRIIALITSISLPGIYVALLAFHSNVLPLPLILSITASLEGLPFTPLVEALLMSTTFELLREAGIRIPRPFGQSISIVGGLVIGEAAVRAGLVSNIMVIIIALTGICSFIVPPTQDSSHFMRILIMIAANIIGFLGITLVLSALIIYMCSLRSFGVPFMSPLAPLQKNSLKDTLIKFPLWTMITRPRSLAGNRSHYNKFRMKKINIKKKD